MARRSSPPRQGSRGSGARSLRLRSSTASPAAAPLTEEGFDHQVGLRLWRDAMARVQGSRDRILECEDFVMGDLSLEPAGALARDPNWESLVYTSPQRKELLINMINALAEVEPIFEKTAPNDNKTTVERNEQTEACLEALRKELIDWPQMIGRGTAQAEYATITMLHENHWEALPEFEDLPLSPSEWAKLTRSEKSTYRPRGSGSSTVYVRPRRTYWRDGEGRPAEHPEYSGRRSGRKTKAAWQRDIEDAMAAKPPFLVRIISPLDCAPVFTTQIDGKRRLAALMVRTLMEEDALLEMNFNWNRSGKDGRPLMIPRGFSRTNAVGSNGKLWFYEFYVRIKGDPCVAYMVGGQETWREYADGATEPAIINLKREWGFTRLPITYPYGLNLPFDDPDDRGVPYMEPVKSALMGFEALITSMQYTAYRRGTSKIAIRPDPQVPAAAYLTPAGDALKNSPV